MNDMSQTSDLLKERANILHMSSAWGIDHDGWLMEKAAEEIESLERYAGALEKQEQRNKDAIRSMFSD
jgi:hypothetical protein